MHEKAAVAALFRPSAQTRKNVTVNGDGTHRQAVRRHRRQQWHRPGDRAASWPPRARASCSSARDAQRLEVAAARVGGEYIAADVTDSDADERIIATCAEQMGGIDVLVNNAGTSYISRLGELTDDEWRQQYELHVMAPMRLMRAAAPRMAGRRRRADRQRLLVVGQAAVAVQRGLLGDEGRAAVALARVRRRLRARRRPHQRRDPGADRPELWLAPGGMAEQLAKQRGITPRGGARAAARQGPDRPLRRRPTRSPT